MKGQRATINDIAMRKRKNNAMHACRIAPCIIYGTTENTTDSVDHNAHLFGGRRMVVHKVLGMLDVGWCVVQWLHVVCV